MRFSSFTYLVGQGLHNLRANRLMTFASMGVLTVCMLLIGAAYLLGVNIDAMVAYIGDQNETGVYMDDNATDEQIAAADAAIRSTPHVVGVTYMSPQDVLATYGDMLADYTNLQQVFENDNPFTPNYRVAVDSPDDIESVSAQLLQIDGVASVNAPLAMADTFTSLQRVINYACYGIVAVLAIVSIVVINNTIKITVFNRRKEIGIMKLVGATNGFIRFPFFVEGVTSGLISASIASGIVCGAYYALCRWYAENPSNLSQMFGGTLVPLESVWYYIVGGFVLLGFFTDLFAPFVAPLADADLMLPAMWGGIITGIGYGMVLRAGANTGGSDTIGQIISRNTSLPVGSTVMAIDVAVCALSAPVFSIENALYAGLSMVISGYVIDAVVDGGNKRRMVLIISDKFPDIAADIMYGLGRGCTKFKATGMYSGAEKPVIMVIVSRRELNTLKTIVRERDPHAIVTVADVTEAFGEGFKDISA